MISIVINVYQESELQLKECLSRIYSNLPEAKVKLILDGVNRPELENLATQYGYDIAIGPHYCSHEKWPLYWIRMLTLFRESQATHCLKFDPDTMMDRTPKLCDYDYYGSLQRHNNDTRNPAFVQGGITGISQRTVNTVLDSKILHDVPPFNQIVSFGGPSEFWPLCDDQLFAWTLRQVDIHPKAWDECFSEWRKPVINEDLKFAVVHPRYFTQ
jgi:hypothetical protein